MEWLARGGWMMYPILLCSVVVLGIVMERFYVIFIHYSPLSNVQFEQLRQLVQQEDIDGAVALLQQQHSPSCSIYLAILNQKTEAQQSKAAELEGDTVLFQLKERLSILSTLGSVTPLMGLLGTVFGMIHVFSQLADTQGSANPAMLAEGIWQALLTTAAGMTIAIPAVLFYHFFNRHIENIAHELQRSANILANQLSQSRDSSKPVYRALQHTNRDGK